MAGRRPRKEESTGEWLNTYADMVTLILCFFVLLYSMSSIDSAKWQILVQSFNPDATILQQIAGGAGNETGEPTDIPPEDPEAKDFDFIYQTIKAYIEQNNLQNEMEIFKGENYSFIVFRNHIFFEGDRYVLLPQGRDILDVLAAALSGLDEKIAEIRILGHTTQVDEDRPNNVSADRFLSSNRATQVLVYLQEKNIIDPKKLISEGYGQYYPVSPIDTEENRARNRRVEILISKDEALSLELEKVYKDLGMNP